MVKKKQQTDLEILQEARDVSIDIAREAKSSFTTTKTIGAGRLALSGYRAAIQAIRYKAVHHALQTPKNKVTKSN